MGAKNQVIAGDYEKKSIVATAGKIVIANGFKQVHLNKDTLEGYEVMDEDNRKSASSAINRGLVGGFLLGPVGMLAGLSVKKKGVYVVAVQFKDGKKSLMEIDEKAYKYLMKVMF
jgi:hypothetical protein